MLADLSQNPISQTLRRLSAERRSGDLQVQSSIGVKTVFFDHGRLVFAASSLRDDRLGESLVEGGHINERQFKEATAFMRARRQRFGEALVAAGVMDKQELGRAVARQVRRIVLSLFPLTDGIASFEDRPCTVPPEYMVSLSIHHLLYQGIKLMTDEALVRRGIGALDRRVSLAEVPPFRLTVEQCSASERELLGRCLSRPSLQRLVEGEDLESFERLRAAYALLEGGVLRDPEEQENAQPVRQADEEGFLLSPLQRGPEEVAGPDTRRAEIVAELARSAGDHEGWLSVSQSAPVTDIIPALQKKIDRYHDLLDAVEDDVELRTDVELILGRAHALARKLESARRATPQPDRAGTRPIQLVPDPPPVAAVRTPPHLPIPLPEAPTPVVQPETPPAAPPPTPIPVESPPPAGPASDAAAQIDRLLSSGNIQMTISDYRSAVRTYWDLVDLAPDVAVYHLRLAVAMARWPETTRRAELEFHEALRLDPECVDAHFQLALYYKGMKLRTRACEQLRIVLSLDPRHKRARGELEVLSPKDTALTSLKKLFR